jgi:hypothetical protein
MIVYERGKLGRAGVEQLPEQQPQHKKPKPSLPRAGSGAGRGLYTTCPYRGSAGPHTEVHRPAPSCRSVPIWLSATGLGVSRAIVVGREEDLLLKEY